MSDVIDVESVDEERSLSRLQEFGFMLVPVVIGIGATLLVGPVAQFYQPDIWAIANASILFSLSSALFVLWYKAPTDERMLFVRIGQGLFPPTPGLTSPLVVIALLGFLFPARALCCLAIGDEDARVDQHDGRDSLHSATNRTDLGR